jgi:glycosyltransferase involved in cell wall biosynthesis
MASIETLQTKLVYFYTESQILPYGQGTSMRQYSNVRAYLDLEFRVQITHFVKGNQGVPAKETLPFPEVTIEHIEYLPPPVSFLHKLAFRVGLSKDILLNAMFPIRPFVVEQVRFHEKKTPKAIHHFEYDNLACAAVRFNNLNAIWSHHDILSWRVPLLWEMRKEFTGVEINRAKQRRIKQLRDSEDWIANSCKLILNIAQHEHIEFHQNRNYTHAQLFPMSWPDEKPVHRNRSWMSDGRLRLLHLGSVEGFIGYDSLRFILEQVFPLFPALQLEKLELQVVGKVGQSEFSRKIRSLAEPYPQVKFLGYADDIRQAYAETDLQVVGGTRATGLRTRIIESFVYGLPVLSTIEAARGVAKLCDGENILLADNAPQFAAALDDVLSDPGRLSVIAENARRVYDQHYSRRVAAAKLASYLEKYL